MTPITPDYTMSSLLNYGSELEGGVEEPALVTMTGHFSSGFVWRRPDLAYFLAKHTRRFSQMPYIPTFSLVAPHARLWDSVTRSPREPAASDASADARPMGFHLLVKRTVILALGVLTSGLLVVSTAEAGPARRAHARGHCAVCRKNVSPKQAFAHIAARRPDRHVHRHVLALVRRAHTSPRGLGGDAAIQTDAPTVLLADRRPSPALEPLGILIPTKAQLRSHEGLARRSPRGPPAAS